MVGEFSSSASSRLIEVRSSFERAPLHVSSLLQHRMLCSRLLMSDGSCSSLFCLLLFLSVPRGVIQNGARVRSQALFPVIRPLPVSPVGSRTSAIRLVNCVSVALNHVINVNQGFPCTNASPLRRTQTHLHPQKTKQNKKTHTKQM